MPLNLKGSTSGGVTIDVPADAGNNTLTFPAATGTAVVATSTTANQLFFGGATSGTLAQSSGLFWDNTNSRLGVGAASPTYTLDISSSAFIIGRFNSSYGGSNAAYIASDGVYSYFGSGTGLQNSLVTNSASNLLLFLTNGSERMRINSAGNVGIGTTSSFGKMTVYAPSSGDAANILANGITSQTTDFRLGSYVADGLYGTAIKTHTNYTSTAATDMSFWTSPPGGTGSLTERMRIASDGAVGIGYTTTSGIGANGLAVSGNLGVGTASVGYKLNVVSSSEIATYITGSSTSAWSASSSNGTLSLVNTAVGNNSTCLLHTAVNYGDSTYGAVKFGAVASASYSADFVIANRNAGTYQENLRLTSIGNLGLGVTPSAWASPFTKAFDIGATGSVATTTNSLRFANNAYYGASGWTYKNTAAAAHYDMINSEHSWYIAGSGTAGAAISFTQAMTLDASGQLLVGASSAYVTAKFEATSAGTIPEIVARNSAGAERIHLYSRYAVGSSYVQSQNSTLLLGTYDNYAMAFLTNNTERARIDANGTLLVGQTSNPATSTVVIKVSTGSGNGVNAQITSNTGTSYPWSNYNASGSYVGGITCTSSATGFPTSSDVSLKDNIKFAKDTLASIVNLPVRQFDWKIDGVHTEYGFVAQEVDEYAPEIVWKNEKWSVDYGRLTPRLVKAIQELAAKVTALEARI